MFKFSVTGADNNTNILKLKLLTSQYPLLELAILYFPEKENVHRNPGVDWRNRFFEHIPQQNTALHLCGKSVFDTILQPNFQKTDVFKELQKASRIQININARQLIFNSQQIHQIYNTLLENKFHLILQYHERSKEWIIPFLIEHRHNLDKIDILLDASLGKGINPVNFSIPEELRSFGSLKIGFAGGLNPDNIKQSLFNIQNLNYPQFWLDLESGARTDNEFDLTKVKNMCEIVF